MKILSHVAASALLLLSAVSMADMVVMSDGDLGGVDGREGVSIGMETYYNTQKTTSVATDGTPLTGSPFNSCSGTLNGCRMGWQIQGRGDGYSIIDPTSPTGAATTPAGLKGEWFMIKDGYFTMKIDDLRLDAAYLNAASNSGIPSGTANTNFNTAAPGNTVASSGATAAALPGGGGLYTKYYDETKFLAKNTAAGTGGCLLPGVGNGSNGCPEAAALTYLQGSPAMAMKYASSSGSYDPATQKSTGYDSLQIGLNIGRMAVEYNNSTTAGYNRDAQGSFSGLVLKDNNSNFAGMAIGGRMYLYGF